MSAPFPLEDRRHHFPKPLYAESTDQAVFRRWSERHADPRRCLIYSMLSSIVWTSRWTNPATRARRVRRETYDFRGARVTLGTYLANESTNIDWHLQKRTRRMNPVPVLSLLTSVSFQHFPKRQETMRSQGLILGLSSLLLSMLVS